MNLLRDISWPLRLLVLSVLIFTLGINIAYADVKFAPPPRDIDVNVNTRANADANANATASADASATAKASVGNTSASSNNTLTFKTQKQVPGMGAPSVFSSHACAYGRSAVLAVRDFGVGGGGQKIDVDCADREWARMMYAFGMEDAARELACLSPSGRKLLACMNDAYSNMYDYGTNWLMADVTQEEYEQQVELVEHRYAQQQIQIDSIQQVADEQHELDNQEIARLKREAAELRAAEQKRIDADVARRAATRAILTKKKGSDK